MLTPVLERTSSATASHLLFRAGGQMNVLKNIRQLGAFVGYHMPNAACSND